MGDFPLVIIEIFSLGAFVLSQFTRVMDGQTARRSERPRYIECSAVKMDIICSMNVSLDGVRNVTLDMYWNAHACE